MGRVSFYDEVRRNRRSSLILAAVLVAVVVALAYSLAFLLAPGSEAMVLAFTLVFMGFYVYGSYVGGDSVLLSSTGAVPAVGDEWVYLRDTVEGLSIAAGIPAPAVYVIPSDEINAFATGRDPEHASVAVTTGLVRLLDRQELEGVVAHEVSHIRNQDIMFMTLVAVMVGLVAILSHVILRTFRFRGRQGRDRGGLGVAVLAVGFVLAVFAPLLTRLVQFAVSRRREFMADASGVELTRYAEGLASALEVIRDHNRGVMDVSEAVSHLFFVDPNRSALDALYATHPPVDERIRRLRAM